MINTVVDSKAPNFRFAKFPNTDFTKSHYVASRLVNGKLSKVLEGTGFHHIAGEAVQDHHHDNPDNLLVTVNLYEVPCRMFSGYSISKTGRPKVKGVKQLVEVVVI